MKDNGGNQDGWYDENLGLTEQELDQFIQAFDKLARDFRELEAEIAPEIERRLREDAGPDLETMTSSPRDTLRFLANPNPARRKAALTLAYQHWEISNDVAFIYERMALSDPDDEVRKTALRAIGTSFARTKDERIGRLLAGLARDDRLTDMMRITAFTSLLRLHGNMDYGVEYGGKSPLVPVSLDEIDWEFVDLYLHGWSDTGREN